MGQMSSAAEPQMTVDAYKKAMAELGVSRVGLETGIPETTAAKIRIAHVAHYLPGWQRRQKYRPRRKRR